MALTFYKCAHCDEVVIKAVDTGDPLTCHGEPMVALVPDDTDAALEKHVPDVEIAPPLVSVQVGSVMHPMTEDHYITLIALECEKCYQVATLTPDSEPKAVFSVAEGDKPLRVYEYCTLHGLWKFEI